MTIEYEVEQQGAVTRVYFMDVTSGWEQLVFAMSDNHFDSAYCNRDLMMRHLELAKSRDALIIITGDFFDAMQGRFDPRRNMDELRPEYRREDYYDFVVADASRILAPFAKNLLLIAPGNHEYAVLKNVNTSLSDRLVSNLRQQGSTVIHGGYGGWIKFLFKIYSYRTSKNLKYFHGSGGEAPVTRGTIQTNRQAVFLPDADIIINGHSHNAYYVPITRERLGDKGKHYFDIQHHIRVPGYLQSYGDGSRGWEVTRGGVPKPLGGFWVKFVAERKSIKITCIPELDMPLPINPTQNLFSGKVLAQDGEYP